MNQNVIVCLIIVSLWAGIATMALVLALRSRNKTQKDLMAVRVSRDKAIKVAQDFQKVNDKLSAAVTTPKTAPSLARQFLDAAAKPARPKPRPSRSSYPATDTVNAAVVGSTVYWSSDPSPSTSCDTSSTSSSSDSGSCGGGGE